MKRRDFLTVASGAAAAAALGPQILGMLAELPPAPPIGPAVVYGAGVPVHLSDPENFVLVDCVIDADEFTGQEMLNRYQTALVRYAEKAYDAARARRDEVNP